jgi:hypothetical protein
MVGLTYRTQTLKDANRDKQGKLLEALEAWDRALRLDENGAWRITGSTGHIYAWSDDPGQPAGVIFVSCRSERHWKAIKRRMKAFARVTQDGEAEGCLKLDRLPTRGEAAIIREVLGIRKRRPAETADHLISHRLISNMPTEGVSSDKNPVSGSGQGIGPQQVPAVLDADRAVSHAVAEKPASEMAPAE